MSNETHEVPMVTLTDGTVWLRDEVEDVMEWIEVMKRHMGDFGKDMIDNVCRTKYGTVVDEIYTPFLEKARWMEGGRFCRVVRNVLACSFDFSRKGDQAVSFSSQSIKNPIAEDEPEEDEKTFIIPVIGGCEYLNIVVDKNSKILIEKDGDIMKVFINPSEDES